MLNHIASPHYHSFLEEDDKSLSHPHNLALHFDVMIHRTYVRSFLIDGGFGLNLCSLSLLNTLGYSKKAINTRRKITIKAYDEVERSSKGLAILLVRTSPIEKYILFQIVDAGPLAYNIVLGRPWIHDMQVVSSTYHQCVKFPYNGTKICIPGDNTLSINSISASTHVPLNREADDFNAVLAECKDKIKSIDLGMGGYQLNSLAVLLVLPRSYGNLHKR